jgi:hypothetical protein
MWDYCFCKKAKFIKMIYTIDMAKMELFSGFRFGTTGVKP